MLDSGPLSSACHPKPDPNFREWLLRHLSKGTEFIVAEIIDYELRRELIRASKQESLKRLDNLVRFWTYEPITTAIMLEAASLWAKGRQEGKPTATPDALDIDVIPAAQARRLNAIVVTDNVGHLSAFVDARPWHQVD